METILLIVTAVSLLVALAMSVTAWRLGREERRRSAARVAALSAAAGISPAELGVNTPAVDHLGPRAVDIAKAPWAPSPLMNVETRPEPDMASTTADVRPILGSTIVPPASSGRQRGLAVVAALLFVGLLGGLVWTMSGRSANVASAAAPGAPLELVSLRHERQASKLAVSGLVRNPATGHPVDHLSAVVFLFDQQGTFVMSAKAPVDFVRLGSGDESPFVVTLDAPAAIARYRVSFRTDQGVVAHVDRRGASPIATSAEQAASLQVK